MQIRAVVHALERNLHHFQKVPEVGLSIRQLHDWCAKHGPFWCVCAVALALCSPGSRLGDGRSLNVDALVKYLNQHRPRCAVYNLEVYKLTASLAVRLIGLWLVIVSQKVTHNV